jgi:hypothetical protein
MKYSIGDLIDIIIDNVKMIAIIIDERPVKDFTKTIYDYKIIVCGIQTPLWVFEDEIQNKFEI